jgi:hypothetical protein
MSKYGWSADESGQIFICSQEESIKPKNIVEKIDFDSEWWRKVSGCGVKGLPFHRDQGSGAKDQAGELTSTRPLRAYLETSGPVRNGGSAGWPSLML